jgi:hypothetical protein
MKLTSKILLLMILLMVAGLFSSNMILKKQYDAMDKTDNYWTYNKVLEQPFRHLHIIGGNGTNIYYEQSSKPSVRLLQEWVKYQGGKVKTYVKNDTLYLNFDFTPANSFEKFWLLNAAPVRIFSPQLLSVTGNNTHFEMLKLKQKNITINMSGRSKFEIESMYADLDSLNVSQSDSSAVVIEMSPDYRKKPAPSGREGKIQFHDVAGGLIVYSPEKEFNESMSINAVTANIQDHSILDIGHAQIKNLDVNVSDSSAVVLSGGTLRKSYVSNSRKKY